jgi:two-component SAPR family response regulator
VGSDKPLNEINKNLGDVFSPNFKAAYNITKAIATGFEYYSMSGMELTKNLATKRQAIIFIASKKEYSVDAFDLNVADYIIKLLTSFRFIQPIDKAREILESNRKEVKIKRTSSFLSVIPILYKG